MQVFINIFSYFTRYQNNRAVKSWMSRIVIVHDQQTQRFTVWSGLSTVRMKTVMAGHHVCVWIWFWLLQSLHFVICYTASVPCLLGLLVLIILDTSKTSFINGFRMLECVWERWENILDINTIYKKIKTLLLHTHTHTRSTHTHIHSIQQDCWTTNKNTNVQNSQIWHDLTK